MRASSLPPGGSVNPPVTKRYNALAPGLRGGSGGIFPPARPPKDLWQQFLQELNPAFRCLLATSARLREIHAHGWTLAIHPEWLRTVARRRNELSAALTRVHNGSPKAIHLVELGQ